MKDPPSTLSQAVAHLRKVASWEARHHRFKPVDVPISMLFAIVDAKGGHVPLKHLYAFSPCAMPTAVNWVKRFVERGWVEFADDDSDKRVRRVRLTAAGEAFLIDYYDVLTGRNGQDTAP